MSIINLKKLNEYRQHTEKEVAVVKDIASYFLSKYPDKPPVEYFNLTPPDDDKEDAYLISDTVCIYALRKPWKYMRLSGKPAYRLYSWILNLIDWWRGYFEYMRNLK